MIEVGPMGPGFFIFFQSEETCGAGGGYPDIPHNAVIIYETLPVDTVKKVVKKVRKYKQKTKEVQISPANVDAIVGTMVDVWSQKDMKAKMELHDISQELAILSYRATIRQLINDDDLALILILAST